MASPPVNPSIFDILTSKNPTVNPSGPHKGNTSNPHFFSPKKLRPWEGFTFSLLERLYNSCLLAEVQRRDHQIGIPFIGKDELKITNEKTSQHLITSWNYRLLKPALEAVRETLHPATWTADTKDKASEGITQTRTRGPDRSKSVRSKDTSRRFDHDYGAISLCDSCRVQDEQSHYQSKERFPKEYKVSLKWNSSMINELTNSAGYWKEGKRNRDKANPVKQAYTYCVKHGCRYGCILTTQEAFLFRIRPIQEFPDPDNQSESALYTTLRSKGLMEWVSVPWETHRSEQDTGFRELTVNLSMWILHILAGNSHRTAWHYPPWEEETLVTQPCPPLHTDVVEVVTAGNESEEPAHPDSSLLPQLPRTSSRKRARSPITQDPAAFSFSNEDHLIPIALAKPAWLDEESDSDTEVDETNDINQPIRRNAPRGAKQNKIRSRKRTKR